MKYNELFNQENDNKQLCCSVCGKIKTYPNCCTKYMEIDRNILFCELCGKEEKIPLCCGEYMIPAET